MEPIYFPFTYVPGAVAEALVTCFDRFIVYRPFNENVPAQMQSWIARRVLDVRVPVIEYEAELKAVVKNFHSWAALHTGSSPQKPTSLKTHLGAMPFFNDISSSQILADIRQKTLDRPTRSDPDPLFEARLFLCLAQEFDRHNDELAIELSGHDRGVADLMRQLNMAEDDPLAKEQKASSQFADPFADYMISDRLDAWIRLFLMDPEFSGVFITHSKAVLEHLLDKSRAAAEVARIESIPLDPSQTDWGKPWQKSLALNLSRLVEDKLEVHSIENIEQPDFPTAEKTASLNIYRVPDQKPREFFSRWAVIDGADSAETARNQPIHNTLLALIEF